MTDITPQQKRVYIEKVLESTTFSRAGQLQRLLRWLASRQLEGAPSPTEHEVGVHALERPPNFDPQLDSLVRKEMSRLRSKLREYYADEGKGDELQLRSARYGLMFLAVQTAGDGTPGSQPTPHVPCVLILPLSAAPDSQAVADLVFNELLSRLADIDQIAVVARTTSLGFANRSGDVREFAATTGADYIIEGTVQKFDDQTKVTLWLAHGRTGRAKLLSTLSDPDLPAFLDMTVERLLGRIAGGA